MKKSIIFTSALLALVLLFVQSRAQVTALASSGPTPYPQNANDFPGEGVVRIFPWMSANRHSFWRERGIKRNSVVLAGDSLLGGWTSAQTDLPDQPIANRGIGGDVSRGLLFRFEEDVLQLEPRAVVLLIGTNDLSALQDPILIINNIRRILDLVHTKAKALPIVICTVPPRKNPKAPILEENLLKLNTDIRKLAVNRPSVKVLDLYQLLSGQLPTQQVEFFQTDQMHLSIEGYKVFGENLRPMLASVLSGTTEEDDLRHKADVLKSDVPASRKLD